MKKIDIKEFSLLLTGKSYEALKHRERKEVNRIYRLYIDGMITLHDE